jgi:ABC-type multidrug transport system fused ATPase/permease subunit
MLISTQQQANFSKSVLPKLLWRFWCHLNRRRQMQFGAVFLLMLVGTFAEVISLGAVIPFLGVLVAPDKVLTHPFAASAAKIIGITSPDDLLLPFTIVFALAAVVAGGLRALLLWSNSCLAYASASDISFEVYRRTLYQPYRIHLTQNSSEVIGSLQYKAGFAIGVLLHALIIVNSFLLLTSLLAVLLVINAAMVLAVVVSFGASYGLLSRMSSKRLANCAGSYSGE